MKKRSRKYSQSFHEADGYIVNPMHQITVAVIGCGATGSYLLYHLARMNIALRAKGHPGIHVTAADGDTVKPHNIGKQLFFEEDIDMFKSIAIIQRINLSYGYNWDAIPDFLMRDSVETKTSIIAHNVIFSCSDQVETRRIIEDTLIHNRRGDQSDRHRVHYWIDCGNAQTTGQVIMYHKTDPRLKSILQRHPDIKDQPDQESCSLAISLGKQDFNVNPMGAIIASQMAWDLMTTGKITYAGVYFNTNNFTATPITFL